MTTEQENITQVFGWTSVICIAVVAVTIVWNWSDAIAELFVFHHKHLVGKNGRKREFHKVLEESTISTYIPDVKSNLFPYPLILCNTDGIDDQIYTWKDSEHPYSYYDLTKDAKKLTEGNGLDIGHAFSSLRHYSPNECLPPVEEGAYDGEGSLAQDYQMPLRGSVQDEVEELEYQALLSEVKENDTNEIIWREQEDTGLDQGEAGSEAWGHSEEAQPDMKSEETPDQDLSESEGLEHDEKGQPVEYSESLPDVPLLSSSDHELQ